MRKYGRTDGTHAAIVRALRQIGVSVQSLADVGDGCPDLLCGFRGKVALIEVKDGNLPPSHKKLTEDEQHWHRAWQGPPVLIVESPEQAIKFLSSIG